MYFFPKTVSQQHQTFVSHLSYSCLLLLLAPFLLSQGSSVLMPYGLHIWWPVHVLLRGGDPELPLRNSTDTVLQNPVLPLSENIGPHIKCMALKLYSSSELLVTKQDIVQIRALNYWVPVFSHYITFNDISLMSWHISEIMIKYGNQS